LLLRSIEAKPPSPCSSQFFSFEGTFRGVFTVSIGYGSLSFAKVSELRFGGLFYLSKSSVGLSNFRCLFLAFPAFPLKNYRPLAFGATKGRGFFICPEFSGHYCCIGRLSKPERSLKRSLSFGSGAFFICPRTLGILDSGA